MKVFGLGSHTGSMTFPMSYDSQSEFCDYSLNRKGWKGLSSLEKSLSVALGVVSALAVALMIAVIVVGVQLNEKEVCKKLPETNVPTAPPGVTRPPIDDRCNTTTRPRPNRRPVTATSSYFSIGEENAGGNESSSVPTSCAISSSKNSTICLTSACSQVAGKILDSLDFTVDPCEHFHQFACGGKSQVDPLWGFKDPGAQIHTRLLGSIKKVLEQNPVTENSSRSFRMAQQYYHSCLNPLKDEEVSVAEMRVMLLNSMAGANEMASSSTANNMQTIGSMLGNIRRDFNGNYVIRVDIARDDKNLTENAIYVSHPDFGMPSVLKDLNVLIAPSELQEMENAEMRQEKTVEHYRNLIKKLWSLVYPEDSANMDQIQGKLEEFEGKLKMIAEETSENPEENYNPLSQVESTQQISLTMATWLREFANNVIRESGVGTQVPNVIVKNVKYLRELEDILNTTEIETIGRYVKLRLLLTLAPHSGIVFVQLFENFRDKVEGRMGQPLTPRWVTCAKETNDLFGWTISHSLVQNILPQMAILKQQLHETMFYLKDSFNETLSLGLSWMSANETRREAQRKLESLETFLGFPTEWMFLLSQALNNNNSASSSSSAFVEHFYSDMSFTDASNYMQNYVELRMWLTKKQLQTSTMSDALNSTWPTFHYPSSSKALYSERENSLALPFGVIDLQSLSSFDTTIPSIQYGSVGVLLAQLLLQGFDEQGSFRTASGNIAPWWDAQTRENFQLNVTSCFGNQYFNGTYSADESGSINDIDNKLLRKVILQNGALSLAYQAYHAKSFDDRYDEILLPGLQNFTPEQLYFVSFAQSHCSSRKLVENAVGNSVTFARHWNCPLPARERVCTVL